jgi:cytochrome c biogenesis protein CcmG/thiol:disulfide interchange protein DsbE
MKVIAFHAPRQYLSRWPAARFKPSAALRQGALVLVIGFFIGALLNEFVLKRPVEHTRVGHVVPEFSTPPVTKNLHGLSSRDLKGTVSFVNVFASWCADCRDEHALIMRIAARGYVAVHGLNYKDEPGAAARWLKTLGNPYVRAGSDRSGEVAAMLGVREPPETLLIGPFGRIIYRHRGPLTREAFRDSILPLLQSLLEIDEGDY